MSRLTGIADEVIDLGAQRVASLVAATVLAQLHLMYAILIAIPCATWYAFNIVRYARRFAGSPVASARSSGS